jgi:single-strand DNA-binding protein
MNIGHFAGRLGADASLKATPAGDEVSSFSLAVEIRRGQNKSTLWVDCSLWGKRAAALNQYLTKGSAVAVQGHVSLRTYEGKQGFVAVMCCNVQEVTLLGGGADRAAAAAAPARAGAVSEGRAEPAAAQAEAEFDDDIPF